MERVDAELPLPVHFVDEFKLNVAAAIVRERDQTPLVLLVHLDHLVNVGVLQRGVRDAALVHALRQELEQRVEHGRSNFLVGAVVAQVDGEDQVQVVVGRVLGQQHVRGGAAVQPDVVHLHRLLGLQFVSHDLHQILELDVERREIAFAVYRDDLLDHFVESVHLFIT